MIQSRTARALMYSWHGGQECPLYAAASSGLVADWDALLAECESIKGDPDNPQDYAKLTEWIKHKQAKQKFSRYRAAGLLGSIVVQGQSYAVLPWVSRSY